MSPRMPDDDNVYRKVEVQMWGDAKFKALSPLQPSGQALFLYLLTGPMTSPIPGLFTAGRAAMAEALDWSLDAFDLAFADAKAFGIADADWKARLVWLPNALRPTNKPTSINVAKGWRRVFDRLPECALKDRAGVALRAFLAESGDVYLSAFEGVDDEPKPKPLASAMPKTKPSGKASAKPKALPRGTQESSRAVDQEKEKEPPLRFPAGTPVGEVVAALVEALQASSHDDARTLHVAADEALRGLGCTVERESEVEDRGDGRSGRVDLLVTAPWRIGIELDRTSPREKSLLKLEALDVDARLVLLRTAPRGQQWTVGRVTVIGLAAPGAQTEPDQVGLLPPALVRPRGTRAHPLDEDQAAAQATADDRQRAASLLEAFTREHQRLRQSTYVAKPQRDYDPALRLVRAFTDAQLVALTALYLVATGDGFDDKPRTPGHLAHAAPLLEERLRKQGRWPVAA